MPPKTDSTVDLEGRHEGNEVARRYCTHPRWYKPSLFTNHAM